MLCWIWQACQGSALCLVIQGFASRALQTSMQVMGSHKVRLEAVRPSSCGHWQCTWYAPTVPVRHVQLQASAQHTRQAGTASLRAHLVQQHPGQLLLRARAVAARLTRVGLEGLLGMVRNPCQQGQGCLPGQRGSYRGICPRLQLLLQLPHACNMPWAELSCKVI